MPNRFSLPELKTSPNPFTTETQRRWVDGPFYRHFQYYQAGWQDGLSPEMIWVGPVSQYT